LRASSLDVPGIPDLHAGQGVGHAGGVLAVVAGGRGLAPADYTLVFYLEDHALEGVGRAAGDGEGARGVHLHGLYARLQGRPLLHALRLRIVASADAPVSIPGSIPGSRRRSCR
jgi:hypothetical protein